MEIRKTHEDLMHRSSAAVVRQEQLTKRLTEAQEAAAADRTMDAEGRAFKIRELTDKAMPAILEQASIVEAVAKYAGADRDTWASLEYQLSIAKYSDSVSSDATIKAAKYDELSRMSAGLLRLTFIEARRQHQLALMWSCLQVREGRPKDVNERDAADYSLDGISVPGREAVLAAIDVTAANATYSRNMYANASRRRPDLLGKLQAGHELHVAARRIQAAAVAETRAEQDAA